MCLRSLRSADLAAHPDLVVSHSHNGKPRMQAGGRKSYGEQKYGHHGQADLDSLAAALAEPKSKPRIGRPPKDRPKVPPPSLGLRHATRCCCVAVTKGFRRTALAVALCHAVRGLQQPWSLFAVLIPFLDSHLYAQMNANFNTSPCRNSLD